MMPQLHDGPTLSCPFLARELEFHATGTCEDCDAREVATLAMGEACGDGGGSAALTMREDCDDTRVTANVVARAPRELRIACFTVRTFCDPVVTGALP
jgi:hypothetical protein